MDADKLVLLTRRESEKEVPNYWIKNLRLRMADQQLTRFGNPYPQMEGVSKQKIFYKRADGVDLTGDLYLPKGYDAKRDGKLPDAEWFNSKLIYRISGKQGGSNVRSLGRFAFVDNHVELLTTNTLGRELRLWTRQAD